MILRRFQRSSESQMSLSHSDDLINTGYISIFCAVVVECSSHFQCSCPPRDIRYLKAVLSKMFLNIYKRVKDFATIGSLPWYHMKWRTILKIPGYPLRAVRYIVQDEVGLHPTVSSSAATFLKKAYQHTDKPHRIKS